jgi:hypothetical protein
VPGSLHQHRTHTHMAVTARAQASGGRRANDSGGRRANDCGGRRANDSGGRRANDSGGRRAKAGGDRATEGFHAIDGALPPARRSPPAPPQGWGGGWPASVLATSLGHSAIHETRELLHDVVGADSAGAHGVSYGVDGMDGSMDGMDAVPHMESAGGDSAGDVYQRLMAREQRVLDTVDRVVNDAEHRSRRQSTFLHLSLHQVGMRTMAAARELLDDLAAVRSPRDAYVALTHPERALYLGVLIILLAMCAAFVEATT